MSPDDDMSDTTGVLDANPQAPRLLHVLNGDSTRMTMEQSSVPGRLLVWPDVLHEGPVPGDLSDDELLVVRARFIASNHWAAFDEVYADMRRWARTLGALDEYDEVVLWFEHDLFDQLLLVRHLDWYARETAPSAALALICIGEFAGVEPFHGLGQLDADQLASLLGTRERVSRRQLELGRAAWSAFRSDDPTALVHFLERDTSALPFLAGALTRFLEDYPDTASGLPRTERQILDELSREPRTPLQLFVACQRREERVYMGDSVFGERLDALARGPVPLVALSADRSPDGVATITDAGRGVLAGDADWIALDGIDRWLGGVHLLGRASWRWDRARRTIVRA